jgi:hypothetical protein
MGKNVMRIKIILAAITTSLINRPFFEDLKLEDFMEKLYQII